SWQRQRHPRFSTNQSLVPIDQCPLRFFRHPLSTSWNIDKLSVPSAQSLLTLRLFFLFLSFGIPHRTLFQQSQFFPRRKSCNTCFAALCPGAPVTPPPGCAPAPHKYNPAIGDR